jgi:hypothetical protein
MTLESFVGPWIYWPFVVAFIAGCAAVTLNFVTIVYTEIWAQVLEVVRLVRKNREPE